MWKNDKMDGEGEVTLADGSNISSKFSNDSMIEV
jgi:hypothetical protein